MSSSRLWFPIVAIALLIPFVLGMKAWLFDGRSGPYTLKVEFRDASGLIKNSHVKIGGIEAGRIEELTLDQKRDIAIADVSLQDGVGGVGLGARADARPVNLLGEKYVDLVVGDLKRPLPSGTTIPLASTSTPVELDDVLNMLDPSVRARLRILVNEAGIALAGRGADFNGLLEELPPAIDQVGQLVAEVEAENRRLALLIEQGDRVLTAFTPQREQLGELVESAGDALEVTTSRRVELANTLKTAPPALTQLRASLQELDSTADAIRPAAGDLRRAAEPLTGTLRELPAFADAATETLRAGRAAAPELTELGRDATPTIEKLGNTSKDVENFFGTADPVFEYLSEGDALKNLIGLFQGWASVISTEDGLNHLFRVRAYADQTALTKAIDEFIALNGGSFPSTKQKGKKSSEDATGKLPDVTGKLPDVTGKLPDVTEKLPLPGVPTDDSKRKAQTPAGDTTRLFDYLFGS